MYPIRGTVLGAVAALICACGPHAHIPLHPSAIPGALSDDDPDAQLAHALAPILHVQRDEWFPLERIVAVVHPTRHIIAYHFLWQDDVEGAWIPFTNPTDEEEVWVGYDSTRAPSELWTYWHGTILHTDWHDRGQPAFDIQWGKHGSLPHGIIESDLPKLKSMRMFYLLTWVGLPDYWLGNISRRGPWCFCHGPTRFRQFDREIATGPALNVVVRTENAHAALAAVFGPSFAGKRQWP